MIRRSARGLAAVVALALCAVGVEGSIAMGLFDHGKASALAGLLGPGGAEWIQGGEIEAWQPDRNLKPQSYFASSAMSERRFREGASHLQLVIEAALAAPDASIWKLPDGVKMAHWLGPAAAGPALEARGERPGATVWARWSGERAYTVVWPKY
jgi:hypothetical protein